MNILKHRIWVFRITLRQLNTTILLWLFIYLFVNFKFVERWSITMRNKSVKNVKQNGRLVWPTTVCLSKGEKILNRTVVITWWKNVVLRGGRKHTSAQLNPLNTNSEQQEVQVLWWCHVRCRRFRVSCSTDRDSCSTFDVRYFSIKYCHLMAIKRRETVALKRKHVTIRTTHDSQRTES